MCGENKTDIEELKEKNKEIYSLKVDVPERSTKSDGLNTSMKEMKKQIKNADEKMLETLEKNIKEKNNDDIAINEESNVKKLANNIDTLMETVKQQVIAENERKIEEARRKEEEERKAKEIAQKQVFVGTYANNYGNTMTILMNNKNDLYYEENKIDINQKNENGAILVYKLDTGEGMDYGYLYPTGTRLSIFDGPNNVEKTTDANKIRIYTTSLGVQDYNYNIYYKID